MVVSVFCRKMREGADELAYDDLGARMEELVATGGFGLVAMRDFPGEDGLNVFFAFFETLDGMKRWRTEAEHLLAQARGRGEFYDWYWGFTAEIDHAYEFAMATGRRDATEPRWAPPGFERADLEDPS